MPTTSTPIYARVALPCPLYRVFDYRLAQPGRIAPGSRVRVPFGRRNLVGVVVELSPDTELPPAQIRPLSELLDAQPVVPPDLLALLRWAAGYYHHPIGEVLAQALPALLRQGRPARIEQTRHWQLSAAGRAVDPADLARAPRQAALLSVLARCPEGADRDRLQREGLYRRDSLRALVDKGWVEERLETPGLDTPGAGAAAPSLNPAQADAVQAVAEHAGFGCFLLDGVTGSGKTEVYIRAIEQALAAGRQTLLLVPEIGLTPQLMQRLRARLAAPMVILHSGLSERERLNAWVAARDGAARIVVGTRSAVFTPLPAPGLFIVDEEHDPSLKQQDGFRYSARDLLIWRARQQDVPVLLGSATPSLESLYNADQGRYQRLHLPNRAGAASAPELKLLDIRGQPLREGLAEPLLGAMRRHLARGEQVLLFLNRRGFAPTLICHECGWVATCRRCDSHLTLHQRRGRLHCHHCDASQEVPVQCPECGSPDLRGLGYGTERIEQTLQQLFPDHPCLRIDRDSTRRKGQLEALLEQAHSGAARILLGTQMLAKGHHFPGVTLVGILEADQRLFSSDFRASERLAQLIVQVAGRAGRAERPGTVLIQTHHPDHPLLRRLVTEGYAAFAAAALAERRDTGLPPYASLALLRAEATDREAPREFLEQAHALALQQSGPEIEFWGPVPAPMEKRAGRYRAQLLVQSAARAALHRLLDAWIPVLAESPAARRIRWSVDVDPVDTF
ncbi:primosomal protein N' [Thiohalobacter thiocyanaticus]|uniref:primosomal protein N' n=1 Tax=Thiohalobacter thiocyanaticus TaxID=585455 RepID=UPI000BBB17E3|nr:primosomal protein N' [Thiohalobacter thiocyanaticus]